MTVEGNIGKLGIDKTGSINKALAAGTDGLTAFVNLVDQVVAKDPRFQAARQAYREAGNDEEKQNIAQSQMNLLQGASLGKVSGRQEAMLALVGLLNNKGTMEEQMRELRNAGGSTIEEAHSFLRQGPGYQYELSEFAKQERLTAAMGKVNEVGGGIASWRTKLYDQFPGLAAAYEGGSVGVGSLVTGIGTGLAGLAGLKWLSGKAGLGAGAAPTAAATPATPAAASPASAASRLIGFGGGAAATIGATAGAAALTGAPILFGGAFLQHQMTGTESGLRSRIVDRRNRLAEYDQLIDLERKGGSDTSVRLLEQERAAMQRQLDSMLQKLEATLREFGEKPIEVSVDVNLGGEKITEDVNRRNARNGRRE